MGSGENGIRQTPFSDAWATPDVGGTGANGILGDFDQGPGPNGIINSPFDKAVVPVPGGQAAAGSLPNPPGYVQVEGGTPGMNAPWDVTSSRNTVDKR